MRPTPKTEREPRRPLRPADRRRIGRAAATWGALTLSGLLIVVALVVWHLIRRGRLLRPTQAPDRRVEWPELSEIPRENEPST